MMIYLPIIIFTLCILLIIAYQDIKKREINIIYLFILSLVSLIYLGISVFKLNSSLWIRYLLQIGVTFLFVLFLYVLGKLTSFLYLGEGDLYTILALSFTNIYNVIPVFLVFIFALFVSLFIPIFNMLFNIFSFNFPKYGFLKSITLMFLGVPIDVNKINALYYTPLEKFSFKNNKLVKTLRLKPNIDAEDEINLIIKNKSKYKINKIWVSPLIPFIIPIVVAYILIIVLYSLGIFIF